MTQHLFRTSHGAALLGILGSLFLITETFADEPSKPTATRALVKTVADAVLRDCDKTPDFNWGEGVLLTGMMRAYLLTEDERYLAFVRDFADDWHKQGIGSLLKERGYCGHWGPGFPLLMLYEATNDKRYLDMVEQINQFMLHKAERTTDGGLSHFNGKPQLWVDTLDMCCPVLTHSARITGRPDFAKVHRIVMDPKEFGND